MRQQVPDRGLLSLTIWQPNGLLLAWIRTGLALMGFGFVVARFGLFLRQLQAMQHAAETRSYGLSLWFGHCPDRRRHLRECFFRVAPPSVGAGVGTWRNRIPSSIGPGRRGCVLSGIGRAGNGDLPGFGAKHRSLVIGDKRFRYRLEHTFKESR